jgi:hypothetical protein
LHQLLIFQTKFAHLIKVGLIVCAFYLWDIFSFFTESGSPVLTQQAAAQGVLGQVLSQTKPVVSSGVTVSQLTSGGSFTIRPSGI